MRIATCVCAAAFAVASMMGTALAATYTTFDLTSGNGVNNGDGTYTFNVGGISLTTSAGLFDDGPNSVAMPGANNASVVQTSVGLGVTSDGDTSTDIDGRGQNDVLIFTFDRLVKIEGVWFSNFDLDDDVDFFFEVGGQLVRHSSYLINVGVDLEGLLDLSLFLGLFPIFDQNLLIGTMFGFGADDDGILGLLVDSFKIKKIKVSDMSTPPSEIPVPAALPLFLAGLAGFRFAMRRKPAGAQA